MQSEGNANHFVSLGLNFGILLLAVWPTWIVLSGLEKSHEVTKTLDDASSTDEERQSADESGEADKDAAALEPEPARQL